MSQPILMAVRGAAVMVAVSLPVAVVVAYYLGWAGVVSFVYGVFVGLLTFASIGVTVALILGKTSQLKFLIGAGVYVGRILLAAAAVLVPVFAGWFPVLPMLGGLVLVYVVESIIVLVETQRFMSQSGFLSQTDASGVEANEQETSEVIVGGAGQIERRVS
ncbi:MAG: hypothetical protein ACR2KW_03620 [Rubrobacter sp.]